jgi:NAD(P)H-flavin reductase
LLYRQELDEWGKRQDWNVEVSLDKEDASWTGRVGLVTTLLDDIDMNCSEGIAVVCGPPVMMKFVTLKLVEMGFQDQNIYLSMERNMSCGIGQCGHCRLGIYYVPMTRSNGFRIFGIEWGSG